MIIIWNWNLDYGRQSAPVEDFVKSNSVIPVLEMSGSRLASTLSSLAINHNHCCHDHRDVWPCRDTDSKCPTNSEQMLNISLWTACGKERWSWWIGCFLTVIYINIGCFFPPLNVCTQPHLYVGKLRRSREKLFGWLAAQIETHIILFAKA